MLTAASPKTVLPYNILWDLGDHHLIAYSSKSKRSTACKLLKQFMLDPRGMNKRATLEETAAHFRVSTKTLSKYVQLYKIPHVRLGRNPSFNIQKVEEYLESQSITLTNGPIRARRLLGFGTEKTQSRFDEALGLG